MPQEILPFSPQGTTQINAVVSVSNKGDRWTYFIGTFPIFSHQADDKRMFRLITSQLINSGACRQIEIIKAFNISKSSVIRALKKLRQDGPEAFFQKRKGRRGGKVMTVEVLEKSQNLLDEGMSRTEIAKQLDVPRDTLRKAIDDGRLKEPKRSEAATDKSHRNVIDAAAADAIGTACTRVEERILASMGKGNGAAVCFETCVDVPNGGALCALPSLLANGLLEGVENFLGKIKGYYTTFQVLLLLAFMSLSRIKTVEKLRGSAPGEFGKLLGLDRIPEARCLRSKIEALSSGDAGEQWATHLSRQWMQMSTEIVGTLYIDGHVRVYNGNLTKLPRRYVSRERLCLRGVTDYWINDALGRPFFVVEKQIDPGLIKTLRQEIVPRLLKDIPNQPTEQELADNPHRCLFIMVFDREGYSPAFFREMWEEHRISCITYHKHPGELWPIEWFSEHKATMPNGEIATMRLAEMGSLVGAGKDGLWMKEVRKLTDSGHQTSLISTAYELPHTQQAVRMFTRWCQENFFGYMMEHFAIDLLWQYGTQPFPDTEIVVNPEWRAMDKHRASLRNKLKYRQTKFGKLEMHPEDEENLTKYRKWATKKAELLEQIEQYEHELENLKSKIKEMPKHITWAQLEDEDKFNQLRPGRKRLMDTIHMIAYRAETAMAGLLLSKTVDSAAARRLLQDLFVTEADLLPEPKDKRLRIRVHSASRPAANRSLARLFYYLNEAQVTYPGTDLRMVYELNGFRLEDL